MVALATLMLCSCRAPTATHVPGTYGEGAYGPPQGLPPSAYTGVPEGAAPGPEPVTDGTPLPFAVAGPWVPPGIAEPWPRDEYLFDGCDKQRPVEVAPDWKVYGLDIEDTVAHYDTIDGCTKVEPSNCVCIYAPRFGAVRTVAALVQNRQQNGPQPVREALPPLHADEVQIAITRLQREEAIAELGTKIPSAYLMRQGDGVLSEKLPPMAFQDAILPFENLQIIQTGKFQQTEKVRLAQCIDAALVWTHEQAVQIILERQAANEVVKDEQAGSVYSAKDLRCPKLRVIKVASSQVACPGDTIDFTIRFDNVGSAPIGNVVILDNLTTRLEYLPDTAQSSVDSTFGFGPNEAGSSVLRWEITNALDVGQGGIVRFRCKVR